MGLSRKEWAPSEASSIAKETYFLGAPDEAQPPLLKPKDVLQRYHKERGIGKGREREEDREVRRRKRKKGRGRREEKKTLQRSVG